VKSMQEKMYRTAYLEIEMDLGALR